MKKKEMVDAIIETLAVKSGGKADNCKKTGHDRLQIEATIEAFSDVAVRELMNGGEIILQPLGKLKVREVAERNARNPRTGETITVPGHKKVMFVPAKALKERFNN